MKKYKHCWNQAKNGYYCDVCGYLSTREKYVAFTQHFNGVRHKNAVKERDGSDSDSEVRIAII